MSDIGEQCGMQIDDTPNATLHSSVNLSLPTGQATK
jgi:hypothetical protein